MKIKTSRKTKHGTIILLSSGTWGRSWNGGGSGIVEEKP